MVTVIQWSCFFCKTLVPMVTIIELSLTNNESELCKGICYHGYYYTIKVSFTPIISSHGYQYTKKVSLSRYWLPWLPITASFTPDIGFHGHHHTKKASFTPDISFHGYHYTIELFFYKTLVPMVTIIELSLTNNESELCKGICSHGYQYTKKVSLTSNMIFHGKNYSIITPDISSHGGH